MKIIDDVLIVLEQSTCSGNELFLTGNLDRKMYLAVNKVLEAAGGKRNKKTKSHVFDSDASDRIEQIILTGEVVVVKDEYDFFPTPKHVVALMFENVVVDNSTKLLEPSAGRGAIAEFAKRLGACVKCYLSRKQN